MDNMTEDKELTFPMRLQKFIACCGVASRRKSEQLMLEGRVQVNGQTVTELGTKVEESDVVLVDGVECILKKNVYYVLNKPEGYLCTVSDDRGRKTIYDLIDNKTKLFSVGRLDYNSQGLIIVTNDGEFANYMMHPSHGVTKQYRVESEQNVPNDLIVRFEKGVNVAGQRYKALAVKKLDNKTLLITLGEGKKREIREVYKFFKTDITKLQRVKIGNMELSDLDIKIGEYKEFSIDILKKMIFFKKKVD